MAPHQLEGGLGPEIEPGGGSPGGGPRAGRVLVCVQGWPFWLQPPGGGGCEPRFSPCGCWGLDPCPRAVSHQVPCSQACDAILTHDMPPAVTWTCVPVLVDEHTCPSWHTSTLGPGGWTHTHTHTHVVP